MAVKPHPTIPGAWLIDWYPNGRKGKREYETYIGAREDAERRHVELRLQHQDDTTPKTNPRLEEVLPDYLAWLDLHRSKGYYKSMVWALEKIRPHFGRLPVSRMTRQTFDEFKKNHKGTPAHCNQCIDYVKVIISWMVERGYARPLPFKVEKLPHFRNIPQPPDPGEFDEFMKEVERNFAKSGASIQDRATKKALLLTMYETGMRFCEARALRWENLHEDGRLYLGRTKTGEARYTFLSPDILALLKPYRKPEGHIFINTVTGEPYADISKLIRANAARAGVRIKGTHGLRHAAGTDTLEANDLRAAQEVLGHSTIRSTEKYTHVATNRKRAVMDATRLYREQERQRRKQSGSAHVDNNSEK